MIYHSDMWKYNEHGDPLERVSVYVLRGNQRDVVAFSYSKDNVLKRKQELRLSGNVEKVKVSAIALRYFMRNNPVGLK